VSRESREGNSQLPETNRHILSLLYTIEVGLRELMIEIFGNLWGPQWYRKCLPPDILTKYVEGRQKERAQPWVQCIPHHPVHYLDFSHLAFIMEKKENWEAAFKSIFRRQDIILGGLRALE